MKLDRRVVALGVVAALTFGTPAAAHAGSKSASHGKKASVSAQKAKANKAKADAARKKAEAARKKAAEARSRFTFPGTVVSVSATGLTVTRKERGVVVQRSFVMDPAAQVKRDGVRVSLAAIQPGDHVMAQGRRVDGQLRVLKLNASSPVAGVQPPVSDTPTATIVI